MRICIISSSYPNDDGVGNTFVEQLVNAIAKLGNQCTVISPLNVYGNKSVSSYKEHEVKTLDGGHAVSVYRPRFWSRNIPFLQVSTNRFFAQRAVEKTMAQGYWWASTAWAVVYRVYQMKGYGGGFSQFVKEVATWPRTRQWEMECNFDAVQKPVSSGRLSGMPETWRANGAQEQATKLAFALMEELQSC